MADTTLEICTSCYNNTQDCACNKGKPPKNPLSDVALAEQFKNRVLLKIRGTLACWPPGCSAKTALALLESTIECMDIKGGEYFDGPGHCF